MTVDKKYLLQKIEASERRIEYLEVQLSKQFEMIVNLKDMFEKTSLLLEKLIDRR
ncbi:MAG: hypothetical protein JSW06_02870 [Thermoplasmatales archaeon]|nr:MAG: hypothetical protein JSW06_02870 [Thermoplasmatales archaeon]